MTLSRHRNLRAILILCEVQQLICYFKYVDNSWWKQVDYPLILCCIVLQIFCCLTCYDIKRTYNFRSPESRSGLIEFLFNEPVELDYRQCCGFISPNTRSDTNEHRDNHSYDMEGDNTRLKIPLTAYSTTGRTCDGRTIIEAGVSARLNHALNASNTLKMWSFYLFYACDFISRVTRLVILIFALSSMSVSDSYGFHVILLSCFIEQAFYFLGVFQYCFILLADQDYIRDIMTAMDKLTNRFRYTGYYEVYTCGFQVNALPGIFCMTLEIIYSFFFFFPSTILLISIFAILLSYSTSSYDDDDDLNDGLWELVFLWVIDWLLTMLALQCVPIVFWLEDYPASSESYIGNISSVTQTPAAGITTEENPNPAQNPPTQQITGPSVVTTTNSRNQRYYYTLATRLALTIITVHFCYKVFVILFIQHLNGEDYHSDGQSGHYHHLYQSAKSMHIYLTFIYFFSLGIWSIVGLSFLLEYHVSLGRIDTMIAWKEFFGLWSESDDSNDRTRSDNVAIIAKDRQFDYRVRSTLFKQLFECEYESQRYLSIGTLLIVEPITAICLLLLPTSYQRESLLIVIAVLCWGLNIVITGGIMMFRAALLFLRKAKQITWLSSRKGIHSCLDLNLDKIYSPLVHLCIGILLLAVCFTLPSISSPTGSIPSGKVLLAVTILRIVLTCHWYVNQFYRNVKNMSDRFVSDLMVYIATNPPFNDEDHDETDWEILLAEANISEVEESVSLWTLQRRTLWAVSTAASMYTQRPGRYILPTRGDPGYQPPIVTMWTREKLIVQLKLYDLQQSQRQQGGLIDDASAGRSMIPKQEVALARQRLRILNYKARRMLLVLAFIKDDGNIESEQGRADPVMNGIHALIGKAGFRDNRNLKKENLIKRLKNHNPYFIQIIGKFI